MLRKNKISMLLSVLANLVNPMQSRLLGRIGRINSVRRLHSSWLLECRLLFYSGDSDFTHSQVSMKTYYWMECWPSSSAPCL